MYSSSYIYVCLIQFRGSVWCMHRTNKQNNPVWHNWGKSNHCFPLAVYSLKCLVSSFFLSLCPAARHCRRRGVTRRGGRALWEAHVELRGEARLEGKHTRREDAEVLYRQRRETRKKKHTEVLWIEFWYGKVRKKTGGRNVDSERERGNSR